MSTFAVFGMTLDVAIAEAKKTTGTTRADPKAGGGARIQISMADWMFIVQRNAEIIMGGVKVKQLSPVFDAPQFAIQFMELARKTGKCRAIRIRAKCVLTDAEGKPIINPKTKAPKTGWVDYHSGMTAQVA